jgi:hypothetical protein
VAKKNPKLKTLPFAHAIVLPKKIETTVPVRKETLSSVSQFLILIFTHMTTC